MNPKKLTKEMKEYDKGVSKAAKSFKMTSSDLHNLYDLLNMISWKDYKGLIEANKMSDWLDNFDYRIEKIIIPELYERRKTTSRRIKR